MDARSSWRRSFIIAGVVLGVGLGGFFDGIVLHQVLQWHHMLTVDYPATTLANLELNTMWDGFFHLTTWLLTVAGVFLLWRVSRRDGFSWSSGHLAGAMLIGWGGFNLVEGIVDHHLIGLHHVRPGENELLFDLGFLAWGAAMVVAGYLLVRTRQTEEVRAAAPEPPAAERATKSRMPGEPCPGC